MIRDVLKRGRMAILLRTKYRGTQCGPRSYVGPGVHMRPMQVTMGAESFIGPECWLAARVTIGNFVMLAGRVAIVGGDHRFDRAGVPSIRAGRGHNLPVVIHDDVWIGYGAIIMHGVTIGEGAIIAAGAVVTKSVEPYSVVAGVPARTLRSRFSEHDRALHEKTLEKLRIMGGYKAETVTGCE
jgi:acetyltransferase-like isoleucine patch superfamily enzyme